jgi:hypothetical protein
MSTEKLTSKLTAYMTDEEKDVIKDRAKELGKTIGAYLAELAVWDKQLDLFRRARRGELTEEKA